MDARRLIVAVVVSLSSLLAALVVCVAAPAGALAAECPNEALRVGPSAALPDCRAYEQVTPVEKGRTEDITFTAADAVVPAEEGAAIALVSPAPLEPGATQFGSRDVFTRTSSGWEMQSVAPVDKEGADYALELGNPDLSLVGFNVFTTLGGISGPFSENTLEVGPPGGPYSVVATTPHESDSFLDGATPDFSSVVFSSTDRELLPEAEAVEEGNEVLYEWSRATGKLQLVNVTSAGSLINTCQAALGQAPRGAGGPADQGDISRDGSKIFFTSPEPEASCSELSRVYMRLDGRETVEVSAPEAGAADPAGEHDAKFEGATPDGSQALFASEARLTKGDPVDAPQLYDYNTETRKLTRVTGGESGTAEGDYVDGSAVISEDGSTIYFAARGKLTAETPSLPEGDEGDDDPYLYRYETATGTTHYIATFQPTANYVESATTPDGSALVIDGLAVLGGPNVIEPAAYEDTDEVYHYDARDNSMVCTSCNSKVVAEPRSGFFPSTVGSSLLVHFGDSVDTMHPMSNDGSMVFFNTSEQLVPQDTNSTETHGSEEVRAPGDDVYEWEQDGTHGCEQEAGCQHLISSGSSHAASILLGASADGSNVYFATAVQLAPTDKDEFEDIYDARIDGGFPLSAPAPGACLSCQGVGSPAPLFGTPASVAFTGDGNPVEAAAEVKTKSKKARKAKKGKARKRRTKRHKAHGKQKRQARELSVRGALRGTSTGSSKGRGR